jgi:hypothetical protein
MWPAFTASFGSVFGLGFAIEGFRMRARELTKRQAKRLVTRTRVSADSRPPQSTRHSSRHYSDKRERNLKMIGALLITLAPFALAWLVWMVFFATNDPGEKIIHARHDRFLGPGGPDDPFAKDRSD